MLVEFLNLDGKHSYKEVDNQKVEEVIARGRDGFFLKDQKYYRFDRMIEEKIAVFKEIDLFTIKVAQARRKIALAQNSISSLLNKEAQSKRESGEQIDYNYLRDNLQKLEEYKNLLKVKVDEINGTNFFEEFKTKSNEEKAVYFTSLKQLGASFESLNSTWLPDFIEWSADGGVEDDPDNIMNANIKRLAQAAATNNVKLFEQFKTIVNKNFEETNQQIARSRVQLSNLAKQLGISSEKPKTETTKQTQETKTTTKALEPDLFKHPIQKGQNLSTIAKIYQENYPWLTWADIYAMNSDGRGANLKDPDMIYAGVLLDVPMKPITDPKILEAKKEIIAKQATKWKAKLEEKKKATESKQTQPAQEKPDLSKLDVGMKYIKQPTEESPAASTSKPIPKPTPKPKSMNEQTQEAISDAASWGKK